MRKFLLPLFCLFTTLAAAQSGRSTVTAGAGGGFNLGEDPYGTASTFVGAYELRIYKYVSAEIGVENMLPTVTVYGGDGFFSKYAGRVTFLPFDVRGVLPLAHGRLELYTGVGGAYVWHSQSESDYYQIVNSWLFQVNGGARVALDRKHHFWAGTTARYYSSLDHNSQAWTSWTGDFGWRF